MMEDMEVFPDLNQWVVESTGALKSLVEEEGIINTCQDGNVIDIGSLIPISKVSDGYYKIDIKIAKNEEISLNTLGNFADWMDEKTDLSTLDCPEDWHACLDGQSVMEDNAATLLDSLMDSESCPFDCDDLFDVLPEKPVNNLIEEIFFPEPLTPPKSPEGVVPESIGNYHSYLPTVADVQLNGKSEELNLSHPPICIIPDVSEEQEFLYSSITSPASLLNDKSELVVALQNLDSTHKESPLDEELLSSNCSPSKGKEIKCIDPFQFAELSTVITVKVDPYTLIQSSDQSVQNIKNSKRKRKVSKLGQKLKKVTRRERKKKQNKEAAARYRIKKRVESGILLNEADNLQEQNMELKEKVQQLTSEISYLKNLMKDVFKAKGLLK